MASEENWLRFNKKAKIVYGDCETFNLNLSFSVNRPWSIALLKCEGEQILEEVETFIKWDDCKFKIGEGAARVTQFNQKVFDSKCIDPKMAFQKLWPVLKWADYVILHNGLRFDCYLLKGYAEWMGEDWKWMMSKIIDTKSIAQGLKLNQPYRPDADNWLEYQYRLSNSVVKGIKTNLTALCKEYGIVVDETRTHGALYDLHLLKQVFEKQKFQIEL